MTSTKVFTALTGAIISLFLHMPEMLHKLSSVALFFIVLDTATGYACAAFDRNWSSHLMRLKLIAKCTQYGLLLGVAGGASLLACTWDFVMAAWGGIIAIEAHSNLENLIRLQAFGVNLGPINPLLERLSQFFESGQLNKGALPATVTESKTVLSATVVSKTVESSKTVEVGQSQEADKSETEKP